MHIKKLLFVALLLLSIGVACISGCKKDEASEPLEPITLVQPDSTIVRLFPGDNQAIEIKFTTDRPINWMKGMYDIDSFGLAGHVPVYSDTLFFVRLDTILPRVNRYTYTGNYHVYDSLDAYDVVRFKISFHAGDSTFKSGGTQNYPAGIVSFSKEFRIDIK